MKDDFEFISQYVIDQAVEDGALIHPYPDLWPWLLITPGIHVKCEADNERTYDQKLIPLLMDCVAQSQHRKRGSAWLVKLDHTVAGEVWAIPNEKGGLTVMSPDEY